MKRGGPLKRKKPLRSKSKLKSNKARQARKRAKYTEYMRSKQWREKRAACLARAGRRCEYEVDGERCAETTYLQAHHLTYRNWKREKPGDLKCLCKWHHRLIESQLRPWNANRRVS